MKTRTLLVSGVALLSILAGACSSDDSSADKSTTTTKAERNKSTTTTKADDAEVTAKDCVDELFAILDDADFSDEEALSSEINDALGVKCVTVDQIALGQELTSREDELSDEGYAFMNGQTREEAEAANVEGDPCVALSEDLPTGAPDVPVPVGDPPTELVIEDLVEGDGDAVIAGAEVEVNYIGVSCSTGVIFDDSYSRGETASFGLDRVIPGWTEGLVGMKVGGQRLLVIPPDMGYGSAGSPPDIAPGETLVFVVDLVAIA